MGKLKHFDPSLATNLPVSTIIITTAVSFTSVVALIQCVRLLLYWSSSVAVSIVFGG